jgi:hypothetical protein
MLADELYSILYVHLIKEEKESINKNYRINNAKRVLVIHMAVGSKLGRFF